MGFSLSNKMLILTTNHVFDEGIFVCESFSSNKHGEASEKIAKLKLGKDRVGCSCPL